METNVAHDVDQNHASEMLTEGATATAHSNAKEEEDGAAEPDASPLRCEVYTVFSGHTCR